MPATSVAATPDVDIATARFFRVLGDANRLRILELLLECPHTVSELATALDAPSGRVSNHRACLRWCRFVEDERKGRTVVYRIADPAVAEALVLGRRLAAGHCEHLATCGRIGPDWI
ncbi:MAG: ArsR/SmtB family transcription factor [Acidimicrobiales bacterium]